MLENLSVPLLDLKAQYATIQAEIGTAIERVLESQHFILGPEVESLEQEVSAYSHCRFGIGVSSGTDALLVALMAVGIRPGDEVITTPYSFFATAGCVARLGAKPIFVDITPTTFNIDPAGIEQVITERTKAIIPVHLFGRMADMNPIMELARQHNLFVIEDAAQAIGSEYHGKRAGSLGHVGCLSFFPSKNLGGYGDGGMVITNDAAIAEKVRLLRSHGASPKYYHHAVGGNFRLDAIQAAVLRVKLKYLDMWIASRQEKAAAYEKLFSQAEFNKNNISIPPDAGYGRHTYYLYVIRTNQRDKLMAHLKASNIGCEVYYPLSLHEQKCFACLGYKHGDFPNSERASGESLALPIYPEMTAAMQTAVVKVIAEYFPIND